MFNDFYPISWSLNATDDTLKHNDVENVWMISKAFYKFGIYLRNSYQPLQKEICNLFYLFGIL